LVTQFVLVAGAQDGTGVVPLLYTREPTKLLTMPNLLVTRKNHQQSATFQRTEDVEDHSITLSAQKVGVQDGIGAVHQHCTKALTKLLSTLKNHA